MNKEEFKKKYFTDSFYWINENNYKKIQEIGIEFGCLNSIGTTSIIEFHKGFTNLGFRTYERNNNITVFQKEPFLLHNQEPTNYDKMIEDYNKYKQKTKFQMDKVASRNASKNNKSNTSLSSVDSFKINQIVYHRSVYEHKEPLKIKGITEDELLLEGDFSGGTHNVCQSSWLPIKGTSRIFNHAFKLKARQDAIDIETLAIPCAGSQDNTYKAMMDMVHAVMVLTAEIELNPEF